MTVQDFEKNLKSLKDMLPVQGKETFVQYLQKEWLPYKEKFVEAWTKNHRHYNSTAASRVEGMHAVLKNYIQVSTNDLDIIFDRIDDAITAQVNRITQENIIAQRKSRNGVSNVPFFFTHLKTNFLVRHHYTYK